MPPDPDPDVAANAPAPPSPFGQQPTVQVEPTPTNPEAMSRTALAFRGQHQANMDARAREVDNLFSKQQLTVDNMSKILDDTTAAMKKAHDPANRSNLGLMALGAGMMSSPGNFGTQIGAGLKAMVPQIEKQRTDDDDYQIKLAQLAMRRAGVENAPLQEKLAYMRALQTGDQTAIRTAEAAMIRAQGQTESAATKAANAAPKGLGGGYMWDPRANGGKGAIVNMTGQTLDPDKMAVGPDGKTTVGSDLHGEDFLKTITDPVMRANVKAWAEYQEPMPGSGGRGLPGIQLNNLQRSLVLQYNPDWQQNEYATLGKGMRDWTGGGFRAKQLTNGQTGYGHLERMQEAAAGMDNSDMPLVNKIINGIKNHTSVDLTGENAPQSVRDFQSMATPFVDEMSKFYGGGVSAQAEKDRWMDLLSSASTPQQLQAAMSEFAMAMHTQFSTMADQKTLDMGGKKLRMHGPGDKYTPEDMAGEYKDVTKNVLSNDIRTDGGRYNVLRRGENRMRSQTVGPDGKVLEPLPQFSSDQWQKAIDRLRANPALADEFDATFSPGKPGLAKKIIGQ